MLPPTPLCVEGGYGKCATHARAAGVEDDVRMGYVYRPPQVVNQGLGLQMQPQKNSNDKQSEAALYLIESGLRLGVDTMESSTHGMDRRGFR